MTDYRRWRLAGGSYFFTVVTHRRRRFLVDAQARACLREAVRGVRETRPFTVDAIVLLPDHLHAVWTLPPGDFDYSTRWQLIKRAFTRAWLAAGGAEAPGSASRNAKGERGVWQRRFFEHTIRGAEDMKGCVDYLHVNPLKHGLAKRVVDWPWSSFRRYVKRGEYGPAWGDPSFWHGEQWDKFEYFE